MIMIEELVSGQVDGMTSASQSWDDATLSIVRQAPEGVTAYDIILAGFDEN
ncbi:hypothetical protein [Streptococcus merionis]|uniref:hypothetical protein n=1 Tax=Streptococcus merionis TaxID=400065 RepID=UPI003517AEE5